MCRRTIIYPKMRRLDLVFCVKLILLCKSTLKIPCHILNFDPIVKRRRIFSSYINTQQPSFSVFYQQQQQQQPTTTSSTATSQDSSSPRTSPATRSTASPAAAQYPPPTPRPLSRRRLLARLLPICHSPPPPPSTTTWSPRPAAAPASAYSRRDISWPDQVGFFLYTGW